MHNQHFFAVFVEVGVEARVRVLPQVKVPLLIRLLPPVPALLLALVLVQLLVQVSLLAPAPRQVPGHLFPIWTKQTEPITLIQILTKVSSCQSLCQGINLRAGKFVTSFLNCKDYIGPLHYYSYLTTLHACTMAVWGNV